MSMDTKRILPNSGEETLFDLLNEALEQAVEDRKQGKATKKDSLVLDETSGEVTAVDA